MSPNLVEANLQRQGAVWPLILALCSSPCAHPWRFVTHLCAFPRPVLQPRTQIRVLKSLAGSIGRRRRGPFESFHLILLLFGQRLSGFSGDGIGLDSRRRRREAGCNSGRGRGERVKNEKSTTAPTTSSASMSVVSILAHGQSLGRRRASLHHSFHCRLVHHHVWAQCFESSRWQHQIGPLLSIHLARTRIERVP